MQREPDTLHQKSHLAALGLAVSKINHDLRNLLSSAQLLGPPRLGSRTRPQRFAPKLLAALDRAIHYCEQTLSYGRAKEPLPERRDVEPAHLFEEVRETLGLSPPGGSAGVGWVADVERGSPPMPIPINCSGSSSTSPATPSRRWRRVPRSTPSATRSASAPAARGQVEDRFQRTSRAFEQRLVFVRGFVPPLGAAGTGPACPIA